MPVTTQTTLGALIDETMDSLYRAAERPARVVIGSNALDNVSDNQLTLSAGQAVPTDILEFGSELTLVTARSSDATPVYTVARNYLGTQAAAHVTGSVGLINPPFYRAQVERWVRRAINGLMNTELPFVTSSVFQTVANGGYVELPSDTIEVYAVRHLGALDNRIADVGGWRFEDSIPTSLVSSGKILRVHSGITDEDELIVTLRRPYTFTGIAEDATIELPLAAADIPVLWAAAYGQSRREVSRAELDKVEEWNQEQAIRAGVNLRVIRDLWGEVYRRVDEAKRIHRVPRTRVFRKTPKVW